MPSIDWMKYVPALALSLGLAPCSAPAKLEKPASDNATTERNTAECRTAAKQQALQRYASSFRTQMRNSKKSRRFDLAPMLFVALLMGGVRLAHAQSADAGRTIAQWHATNGTCRNVNVPALEAIGACEQRDTFSKVLSLMDYCYGPTEKAGPVTWNPCDRAKKAQDSALAQTKANFHRRGGVFVLPAGLNGNTKSFFVVDSGAANVQIPQEVADELMRNGTLNQSDFLGERRFVVADGRGVLQKIIRLRSVQVGDRTMENVLAAIGAPRSQALLGQSLLRRLNWWKIDNINNAIELEFTGSF